VVPSLSAKPAIDPITAQTAQGIGQGIGPRNWPKRTGLCHYESMAKTVIVKLTDDIDGGDAEETIHFSLDGKSYEIDVNARNAAQLRATFTPFIEKGRSSSGGGRLERPAPTARRVRRHCFSQLSEDEKKALQGVGRHGHRSAYQRQPGEQLGGRRKTLVTHRLQAGRIVGYYLDGPRRAGRGSEVGPRRRNRAVSAY